MSATQDNIDSLCHQIQVMDLQDSQEQRLAAVHQRLLARGIHQTYSAAIIVKMLSGDIVPLGIHMGQPTKMLPYGFVAQFGYNPSVVGRLSFLDENGQSVLQELSWMEIYGSVGAIPLVHLLIQEEEDPDRDAKLQLLQRVIREKNVRTECEEDELWSLYSSWNLTYCPPPRSRKPNRWTKLVDFVDAMMGHRIQGDLRSHVDAHPHVFLEMTQEEVQERDRKDKEDKEREEEERWITTWNDIRAQQAGSILRQMEDPAFIARREAVQASLLRLMEQDPDFSFLAGGVAMHQNRRLLLNYFTVQELVEMGVPPTRLSVDGWITRWHEMKQKAEAYVARPHQA